MKIKSFLNCTEQEVESKQFSIFIGISMGNKYFTQEAIGQYILWALENSKQDVLILIADKNHVVNYEVFNGLSRQKALRTALKKGSDTENSIMHLMRTLPEKKRSRINICRWGEARKSKYYKDKIKVVMEEFQCNEQFRDLIIKIVRENLGSKAKALDHDKLKKLSLYVLDELPILLNGVEYKGKTYNLHPYPGLSGLDNLLIGLQNSTLFPELSKRMEIKNRIAIIEAYVE